MIGQTVSHYKILEKIGEGGMGIVYKAEDTKLLRSVALKFLPPEMTRDLDAKKRFIQEARAASALDHPNIAVVHEVDETADGHSFICMAYYDGQTLKSRLTKAPVSIEEAVRIALQIASGLQRAHESGIVHRDIKPGNIIITSKGEVKIVDFGLAKLAAQTRETRSQVTGGTAAYMAPEQILGSEADARSDLFSLGVVLYEATVGRRPFIGEHEAAIFYSIVNAEPAPPSTLRSEISADLERIILRLLEKDPKKRYQTAADLREDLKHFLGDKPTPQPIIQLRKVLRGKHSVLFIAASAVIVATVILYSAGPLQQWLWGPKLPERMLIGVMPFTNIGGDSSKQALCNGLFEIVTRKLAQLHTLRKELLVFGPSATRKIASTNDAYRNLGATLAVDCSLQWEPNQIKVTVSLEDARTSLVISSKSVESRTGALSDLESRVLETITEMIGLKLRPADLSGLAVGGTQEESAHDLYVRARGDLLEYTSTGKLSNAISLFERAIRIDPQYAQAQAGLGEAFLRMYGATRDAHWVDSAEIACARASKWKDLLPEVSLAAGMIHAAKGKYELAILEFKSLLENDSLNFDAYRELGDAYAAVRDSASAEDTYKKAINIRPYDWSGYNYLGRYYYFSHQYGRAIKMWKEVVRLRPNNAGGYTNVGAVYFQIQDWNNARQQFELAIEKDTNSYSAYSNLGALYYYDSVYDLSAKAYNKALRLIATDHRVWAGLAASYRALGSTKIAREASEKAAELVQSNLKVNPRDMKSLARLAGYYVTLGKKDSALPLIHKALSLASNDPEVLGHVGTIYERLGEREQALKWLAEALKGGYSTTSITYDPDMKGLRGDPRFQKLLKEATGKK
jgi:serine/threonine protein kinase/tetratricopeptide (TPR) repeat protein